MFKAEEIVKLATIGGAKVLRMEHEIGSLEVSKKADLVLIETDSLNMFPIHDPYSAIVYSANASNVDSVWINGRQVLKNKQSIFNQKHVKESLAEEMQTFGQRAIERAQAL